MGFFFVAKLRDLGFFRGPLFWVFLQVWKSLGFFWAATALGSSVFRIFLGGLNKGLPSVRGSYRD